MDRINLQEQFSTRYRVAFDTAYDADDRRAAASSGPDPDPERNAVRTPRPVATTHTNIPLVRKCNFRC